MLGTQGTSSRVLEAPISGHLGCTSRYVSILQDMYVALVIAISEGGGPPNLNAYVGNVPVCVSMFVCA